MNRRLALVLVAAFALAAGVATWGYVEARQGASASRSRLIDTRSKVRNLSAHVRSLAEARDQSGIVRARLTRTLRADERILRVTLGTPYVPRERRGPVTGRHDLFAPGDSRITKFRLIDSTDGIPPAIVVAWRRGVLNGRPLETGVTVWQVRRPLRPTETVNARDLHWRLAYQIDLPMFHNLPAFIGPLGDQRAAKTYGDVGLTFEVGDATGDGHLDILIIDASSGSGGGAIYRLLAWTHDALRQIFFRDHGEGLITPVNGMLRIEGAVWPKGCDAAHGCGRYTTYLKWNGTGWAVISRRTQIDKGSLRYSRTH